MDSFLGDDGLYNASTELKPCPFASLQVLVVTQIAVYDVNYFHTVVAAHNHSPIDVLASPTPPH